MLTIINDTTQYPPRLVIESNTIGDILKECSHRFHVSDKIGEALSALGFAFIDAIEGNGHAYVLKMKKAARHGQF